MNPPPLPRRLLRAIAPAEDRAAMIGDLDEEFRQRAAQSVAGVRAWYWLQALASLPAAARLRWRRAAPFTGLRGDVHRALRGLGRNPGFAAAAIVTMALGSGMTTGVASILEAVLLRPLPYPNAARVMAIQEHDGTRQGRGMSWRDFTDLSASLRSFDTVAAYSGGSRALTGNGPAERVSAAEVTERFFDVLGITPVLGRPFTAADMQRGAAPVVILTAQSWKRRLGGDPSAIGRSLMLSGVSHTIIGVLPSDFVFPPRGDPDLWLPLRPSRAQEERPYWHFLDMIGSRRADVSNAHALEELRALAQAWNRSGDNWHATTGLGAIGLREDMVAGVRPALLVLLGAALVVLLASAFNVSGLVLARGAARAREVNVRAALGASRWRIVRSLIVEAAVIALLGATAGVVLSVWAVQALGTTIPLRFRAVLPYANHLSVSPSAAMVSLAVTIAAIVVAGVLPAYGARWMANPLAGGQRATAGRLETRVRGTIVAAQVALAVVLLAGAALIGRSVLLLGRLSPGFNIDGLVAGRLNFPAGKYDTPPSALAAVDRLLETVRAVPGVSGAEIINQLPLAGRNNTGDFAIVGRSSTPKSDPLIRDVTPGYFGLMGLPLLEGRPLDRTDKAGAPPVVVINRTLARVAFGGESPIGQRIRFEFFEGRPEWTIVGIVGDEQFDGLDRPMSGVVYFPFAQDPSGSFGIVVRAAAPEAIVPALRSAVEKVDPDLPLYGIQTLARSVSDSNAMFLRRLVARLLTVFAVTTLLLAAIGVYGVLAESIAARTKEIGLRVALGATRGDIVALSVRSGLAPAAIGLIAGLALALACGPVVRSLLFGISSIDLPSLAAVCAVVALVALAACAIPTRRALTVPVASALRQE